jgi:hypothetical protein
MRRFAVLLTILTILTGAAAYAQDSRGSITGQVTDPSGAAVASAPVTVTNTDNGAVANVTTTGQGFYTAPSLMPGPYSVTVKVQGFKEFVRSGIQLETQQNATINIKLAVGANAEVVTVTATNPLIDTADASTGQVLTTEEVEDLPSDGRSPLGFARIEYGAIVKAKHALGGASPVSNSTMDDFSLGGGNSGSNEYLLNGVPNMEDSGRTAGFNPAMDATNEVRVDVFGANVTYGDTSGGTINITTRSGTNQFHGSASEFYQASGCSGLGGPSVTFTSRSANHCDWMAALPYATKVGVALPPAAHENQYGGTIGGPIWIPHVFDGRNKLFFFYAYEAYVGAQPPAQTIGSVPTAAERTGDFSALLALGVGYQLYNPNSVTGTITNNSRTAIPGNVFSNAGLTLDPIAQAYLKFVPLPNYNGPTTQPNGENNYTTFTPTNQDYRSHMGRIDYNISSKDKVFGTAQRSRYLVSASNYFHNVLSGTNTDQIHGGGQVEEVHTFSSTMFLDTRGSVTRYDNANAISSTGVSPTVLGFPGYLASAATTLALPQITFTDATNPLSYSTQPGSFENFDTIQLFSTLTKNWRAHTFLGGVDFRAYKGSYLTPGYADGQFSFTNTSTNNPVSKGNTAAPATFGASFANFLLGIPEGGTQAVTPAFQYNSFLNSFFVQDDWKARPNLTVSVGVRFEHEIPVNESQNRMVNGFNPSAINEATTAAETNYAAHPSSLLAAASFMPTGGATYASSSNRYPYHVAPMYFSPRLGITWAPGFLEGKGVVRIGFGIYTNPFNDYDQGQTYGYSATTAYAQTITGGLTNNTIEDPFPTASTAAVVNPIQEPTGNALGVNANLGAKMVFYSPTIKVPYSERFSIDYQYQIGNTVLVDVGYLHNYQVHLSYSNTVDSIPLLPYLSTSPYYSVAATNLLTGATYTGGPATTSITNPFKGVAGMTGTLSTGSTIAPNQFLSAYPEFSSGNVTMQLIPGAMSDYNALNTRITKTMGHGLTINGIFEWSRQLGTFNQLNPGGPLNYGETTSDYPYHLAAYGTYQIPVGRGRQFFSNDNRILDGVVGGWKVSAVYQFLSGMPISWGNAIYKGTGSWSDFHNVQHSSANRTAGETVFNTATIDPRVVANPLAAVDNNPNDAGFNPDIQPNAENFRTFPAYLLRQDYTSDWDGTVEKDITTVESVKVQFRLDCFNMLNRPQYNTPNVSPTSSAFGTTSGVYSGTFARLFQGGVHIVW